MFGWTDPPHREHDPASIEGNDADRRDPSPKVWTDPAQDEQHEAPSCRHPPSRARGVAIGHATRWPSTRRQVDPAVRALTGTLPALWQRQNDANCALAARRRTTAASPTRAAADTASPDAVPLRTFPLLSRALTSRSTYARVNGSFPGYPNRFPASGIQVVPRYRAGFARRSTAEPSVGCDEEERIVDPDR